MTEHAKKRMYFLLGMKRERKEVEFRTKYILPGPPKIEWFCGLKRDEISLFAIRCKFYDIRILGFEVSQESKHPLYIVTYEEFSKEYDSNWWNLALNYFEIVGVQNMIIPSIEVPIEILAKYI